MKENNEKTLVEQAGWDEADTVSEGASWIHDDVHGGGHSHRVTRLRIIIAGASASGPRVVNGSEGTGNGNSAGRKAAGIT